MTDITPPNGFHDAFAEAEAAALGTDAPAPEADTAPPERPRNELGQFAAQEPEPVEEAPAEVQAADEAAAERLLAGKYKNVDDLERAYQELQSMAGRQGSELSELRSAFDARFNELDARLNQTPAPAPVQITSDLIDENPAYAAQLAYEQDNGTAFAIAYERWQEEAPGAAAAFAATKMAESKVQEAEARYAARIDELEKRFAPAATELNQQKQTAELSRVVTDFPEIPSLLENGQIAEIAGQYQHIGNGLVSADPVEKASALRAAAEIARGRMSDTLKATTQEVGRQTAEEARRAAEEAHVVSSSTATSTATENLSEGEQIAASVLARVQQRQDGWNNAWVRNGQGHPQ